MGGAVVDSDLNTYQVAFQPVGKRADVPEGETLLEAARRAGIPLAADCGGQGTCGQCRVTVVAGEVTAPEAAEARLAASGLLGPKDRLACRARVAGPVTVQVPRDSLFSGQRFQAEGMSRPVAAEPLVRGYPVSCTPPSREDSRSDLGRVIRFLEESERIAGLWAEPAVVRELPGVARDSGWRLTAHLRGREIVGFTPAGEGPVGLAVDLGSTKLAGYLVDLETGRELAAAGTVNPQIVYGEDVVSRLGHARRTPEGARELAAMLRATLNDLVGELGARAGVARSRIADICLVGNPAMVHLLLELPVAQLAAAPYVAATGLPLDFKAREVGLVLAPGAWMHVPPSVGGFVGADHVAVVLAAGLDRCVGAALAVDIGTNTEISVACPGRAARFAASCASGPAFEGAHIRDGMRAAPGAVETVRITPEGVRAQTVGGGPALGLCGSGILDAVAELRRTGALDERGHLRAGAAGVRPGPDGLEFVVVSGADTGHGRDVVVSQRDVVEIQLAKAAIRAGIDTLLEAAGLTAEEVTEVVVAGAFGSYLNLASAERVGLLPRFPRARYVRAGNAAGEGAKLALLSGAERRRAREIGGRWRHVELNDQPGFRRRLALALRFAAGAVGDGPEADSGLGA